MPQVKMKSLPPNGPGNPAVSSKYVKLLVAQKHESVRASIAIPIRNPETPVPTATLEKEAQGKPAEFKPPSITDIETEWEDRQKQLATKAAIAWQAAHRPAELVRKFTIPSAAEKLRQTLPIITGAQLAANIALEKHSRMLRYEPSPLSDAQKKQVLEYSAAYSRINEVEHITGIPEHFIAHYISEDLRNGVVKKAITLIKKGFKTKAISDELSYDPKTIENWVAWSGNAHLLHNGILVQARFDEYKKQEEGKRKARNQNKKSN